MDSIPKFSDTLFLSGVACWIQAAEFDACSMLFPSRINSFWAWDPEQATPDLIQTPRHIFFAQVILDFNKRLILHDKFDGEVSLQRPHLAMET